VTRGHPRGKFSMAVLRTALDSQPRSGCIPDRQLVGPGSQEIAAYAVESDAPDVIHRRGLDHAPEAVLHGSPADAEFLADVEDARRILPGGQGQPMTPLDDEAARRARMLLVLVQLRIGQQFDQLRRERSLHPLLDLHGLRAIGDLECYLEQRQHAAPGLVQACRGQLQHGLLQQPAERVALRGRRCGLFERAVVDRDREQVRARGHVEHELLAAA
jgi:hypothetical protein